MAKVAYGTITSKAYAESISEFRGWFQRIASYVAKSPGAKTDVVASINSMLANFAGAAIKAYTSGAAVSMNNSTNAKSVAGTLNTAGATPVANLPATSAIVNNAEQVIIPITGTIGTRITLTVAGGVITAGVLS